MSCMSMITCPAVRKTVTWPNLCRASEVCANNQVIPLNINAPSKIQSKGSLGKLNLKAERCDPKVAPIPQKSTKQNKHRQEIMCLSEYLSYPILSYPILSYPILSYLSTYYSKYYSICVCRCSPEAHRHHCRLHTGPSCFFDAKLCSYYTLSRSGPERSFPVALPGTPGRCGNGTPRETTRGWKVHPPKSLPAARAHHCQKYSSGLDHKGYTAKKIPRLQVAVHPSTRIEIGLSHPVKVQCWKLTTNMFPDKLASLEAGWLRKNSIYCSTCRFSMDFRDYEAIPPAIV